MQPNRGSNRSNEPARSNAPMRIAPADTAGGVPVMPTAQPRRAARRRGPINPVYLLLLTVLPLGLLAIMVWAASGLFPRSDSPRIEPTAVITPGNSLALDLEAAYDKNGAAYRREGDIIYVTGTVKNNAKQPVHNVTLKAFLYNDGDAGHPELVGSGLGWALGDIAPGATAPFTVTAQLSSAHPGTGIGTPTPAPQDFKTVQVLVDQVWADPTAIP